MDGTIAPVPGEPAPGPMTAADIGKPRCRRKAAPPASAPSITKFAGNLGNLGNPPVKPAEIRHLEGGSAVASAEPATGNLGNPAPEPAGNDDGAGPCAPGTDPFARLTDADRERAANIPAGGGGEAGDDSDAVELQPCPEQNPPPHRFKHWVHGEPSGVWLYHDAAGGLLCAVARYDVAKPDGSPGKDVLPWTFGRRVWTDRNGKPRDIVGWHCKAPPAPRLLYGLDRLAARPAAPVLVTEGEKAADAAALLFPDAVCITSQGGSKAPGKSDWTPLQGRRVTIWPDHDEPGAGYAAKVAELVTLAGAEVVRTVEVPGDWPKGWDLADALPDGVAPERLAELLADAPDGAAAELPHGFRMTAGGLYFFPEPTKRNPEGLPSWVAAPFRVVGLTRDVAGEGWGVLLRWRDREGRQHQWAIPRRMIHRPGSEIAEERKRPVSHV